MLQAPSLDPRLRPEEARRFGSREWARNLVAGEAAASVSDRLRRVELTQAPTEAASASVLREQGRHRLLRFAVCLATGSFTVRMFPAGPFDELRCFQRQVAPRSQHEFEYITRLTPHDSATENYRPFARFAVRGEREPLPSVARNREFWQVLWAALRLRALPVPRFDRDPASHEGLLLLSRGLLSGVFRRKQPKKDIPCAEVLDVIRKHLDAPHRIAWFESGLPPAGPGETLHRYYLDANLGAYLVRDEGGRRTLLRATRSGDPSGQGLWVYSSEADVEGA